MTPSGRSTEPVYPDLASKIAVVTGGSKGIGAAACRQLAANGANVVVVAREQTAIDRLVGELVDNGHLASGYSVDCNDRAAVFELAGQLERTLGPVEIVVAFAGGFRAPTPFLEITEAEWHEVIDWNLTSTFHTLQAFLPAMVARRGGSIVTMSSCTGRQIDRTITASYAAAKGGIVLLTQHVALEMAPHQIRVNCVAPATTLTERLAESMSAERLATIDAMTPLGHVGRPEDSAAATLFLLSAASAWTTGVTIDVAGGRVMR
jgi:3-oxoacyl-[acyl-carrier protein] reductase